MNRLVSGTATIAAPDLKAQHFVDVIEPMCSRIIRERTRLHLASCYDLSTRSTRWTDDLRRKNASLDVLEAVLECHVLFLDVTHDCQAATYLLGLRDGLSAFPTVLVSAGPSKLPVIESWCRRLDASEGASNPAQYCIDLTQSDAVARAANALGRFALSKLESVAPIRKDDMGSAIEPLLTSRYLVRRPAADCSEGEWPLPHGGRISIETGALTSLSEYDHWVNPEPRTMELSRIVDGTLSGVIRKRGAHWLSPDRTDDHMRVRLAEKMHGRTVVPLNKVIAVKPHPKSFLARVNKVKSVLNVAAIDHEYQQEPVNGEGESFAYLSIDIRRGLRAALEAAERGRAKRLLVPLMKPGGLDQDIRVTAHVMVNTIFDYFERVQKSSIEHIAIASSAGLEEAACRRAVTNELKSPDGDHREG